MAERGNFLIGYGERLASDMAAPLGGAPKQHPYSFTEARKRLAPRIKATVRELESLPSVVCPKNQTVALVTLHPTYIAKSYYPAELLKTYGLETIGSRSREVSPEKWTKKKPPASAITSELFVAGTRSRFHNLAENISGLRETSTGAEDLIKIEDFRMQPAEEKLKALRSADQQPLLEVVLHAQPVAEDAFILEGFEAYLQTLDIKADLDKRRFFAEGLCFLPLRVPREVAAEVVKYSFLRLAREMPADCRNRGQSIATSGLRCSTAASKQILVSIHGFSEKKLRTLAMLYQNFRTTEPPSLLHCCLDHFRTALQRIVLTQMSITIAFSTRTR